MTGSGEPDRSGRHELDAVTTDDALAVLEALHPVALDNLAADAASIT